MKNRRRKYSDLFQLPHKYTFAVGYTCTKVSHENFVQGNAPCLSLKEKRKHHHSKWCWLKQKGFPGASSWNNCVESSKEVLLYCCSFLRKIPNKLKDSCQYLYKKTCCCLFLRRLEYVCIHTLVPMRKILEKLYYKQTKKTHSEFGALFLMLIFTTLICYCWYLIYISSSLSQWKAQLLEPCIVWAACLCLLQLRSSHGHNGKSEHTKLGKIIVSFIDYTSLKQQVYHLFRVVFVRVIFTKSWTHGHKYRAAVLPATPIGRKLQTLLKWNWMVGCFHETQPPTCLPPSIHLWRLAASFPSSFCIPAPSQ